MGHAVDYLIASPADLVEAAFAETGHHDRWRWEQPWAGFAAMVDRGGPVAALGEWLRDAWVAALDAVPENGRALVISHGRMIEIGVIACLPGLPGEELASWGDSLH
jgi:hypothetical protein